MTPTEIAAARALIAATTPGPWCSGGYTSIQSVPRIREYDTDGDVEIDIAHVPAKYGDTATEQGVRDAAFISAARTGWPAALDRIEELEREMILFEGACGARCGQDGDDGCGCVVCAVHGLCHLCEAEALAKRAEAAEARVAELEREVERQRGTIGSLADWREHKRRASDAEAEVARLRAALERHGEHLGAVPGRASQSDPRACNSFFDEDCTCGLDAALEPSR